MSTNSSSCLLAINNTLMFSGRRPNWLVTSSFLYRGSLIFLGLHRSTLCFTASFLSGSHITTWEWQFSSPSYGERWGYLYLFIIRKNSRQSQSKSSTIFLTWHSPKATHKSIQLNPLLTDFRGPTIFLCYRWTSVIVDREIRVINLKGPWICICYRRNSVGGGSDRAGLDCML